VIVETACITRNKIFLGVVMSDEKILPCTIIKYCYVNHYYCITFFIDRRYISVPDYNEALSDIIEES
jgi:hypothetical protein